MCYATELIKEEKNLQRLVGLQCDNRHIQKEARMSMKTMFN